MDKEKIKNYIYRLEIKIGLYFLAQCDEAKEEYRREVEIVKNLASSLDGAFNLSIKKLLDEQFLSSGDSYGIRTRECRLERAMC